MYKPRWDERDAIFEGFQAADAKLLERSFLCPLCVEADCFVRAPFT